MTLTNFNATTPQSEVVKNLIEAYVTLNLSNIEPFVSKDYKYQAFPKVADLPDEPKGKHIERYGAFFSLLNKVEVGIQHRLRARRLTVITAIIVHSARNH